MRPPIPAKPAPSPRGRVRPPNVLKQESQGDGVDPARFKSSIVSHGRLRAFADTVLVPFLDLSPKLFRKLLGRQKKPIAQLCLQLFGLLIRPMAGKPWQQIFKTLLERPEDWFRILGLWAEREAPLQPNAQVAPGRVLQDIIIQDGRPASACGPEDRVPRGWQSSRISSRICSLCRCLSEGIAADPGERSRHVVRARSRCCSVAC